ncbi:MAG: phosphoglycerate transporter [Chloroflexi bacterium]|nr:phosphoglycerate transporter [Chloroflexota bacterium]
MPETPYRLGWFATGRGPGSRRLLTAAHEAITSGELPARIEYVFCNREQGEAEGSDEFIRLVHSYDLPLITLSSRKFRHAWTGARQWRSLFDHEVLQRISSYPVNLIVLAGYMLIFGKDLCRAHSVLNLHPAAPGGPEGTWQEVIWSLIAQKASESGVMTHLATEAVDKGPVVTYCLFPIRGQEFDQGWSQIEGSSIEDIQAQEGETNSLFMAIRKAQVEREVPLLLSTLHAFAEGRLHMEKGRVSFARKRSSNGYDMTKEIEALLRRRR